MIVLIYSHTVGLKHEILYDDVEICTLHSLHFNRYTQANMEWRRRYRLSFLLIFIVITPNAEQISQWLFLFSIVLVHCYCSFQAENGNPNKSKTIWRCFQCFTTAKFIGNNHTTYIVHQLSCTFIEIVFSEWLKFEQKQMKQQDKLKCINKIMNTMCWFCFVYSGRTTKFGKIWKMSSIIYDSFSN